jgi:hypothetical protein
MMIMSVAAPALLSTIAQRCLMDRLVAITNQAISLSLETLRLHPPGPTVNPRDAATPTPKNMVELKAWMDDRDVFGRIRYTQRLLQDKQKMLTCQHPTDPSGDTRRWTVETSEDSNQVVVRSQGPDVQQLIQAMDHCSEARCQDHRPEAPEPMCRSVFCRCEALHEALLQISQSVLQIGALLQQILHEHTRYATSWFGSLNDAVLLGRLERALATLDARIDRFLLTVPWSQLVLSVEGN